MPQAPSLFSAIDSSEEVVRTFDFSGGMIAGEIFAGTPVCTITAASGIDASPQTRLLAGPTVSGQTASVLIGNMIAGVIYKIALLADTSAGQQLDLWTLQECVPA